MILATIKLQTDCIYLAEIVIFSKTSGKHIALVNRVLTVLQNEGVILTLQKCRFTTNTIDYFGHVIRPRGFEISLFATDAFKRLENPLIVKKLRLFFGISNVFRRFVSNLAGIAAYKLLNRKFQMAQLKEFKPLNDEIHKAVTTLQENRKRRSNHPSYRYRTLEGTTHSI